VLLLEHHGKTLLRRHGIPTPAGRLVLDEASLLDAVTGGGGKVLKAQVAAGGRGKSGGVLFADDRASALAAYRSLKQKTIAGQPVEAVLVEERIEFANERYAGIQVENGRLLLLLAARGGVDIEEITAGDAANLRALELNVLDGPDPAAMQKVFADLGFAEALWRAYEHVARRLFTLARSCDAATAEINPLVETLDGKLVALDARIFLDETALGRQSELAALRPETHEDAKSSPPGPSFRDNPEGGSIGLIGFGSGLNITFMDWFATIGGTVGTLVDIDAMVTGGKPEVGFAAAFEHMDRRPGIHAVLLCIISCGNRMDDVVRAMIAAHHARSADAKPVVFYLRGNRMRFAQELLDAAGIRNSPTLATAVANVVALSKGSPS
jgi:succinyl-CoA synthetase beta subunit